MLGEIRARDMHGGQHRSADLKRALSFYEAAVAADMVLNSLSTNEKEQVRKNVDCLKVYLRTRKAPPDCPPLQ
jgi:hypothetical protein